MEEKRVALFLGAPTVTVHAPETPKNKGFLETVRSAMAGTLSPNPRFATRRESAPNVFPGESAIGYFSTFEYARPVNGYAPTKRPEANERTCQCNAGHFHEPGYPASWSILP